MVKYRNPRIEAELAEDLEQDAEIEVQKEEPKSVDEQVWKQRYGDLRRHQAERDAQYKSEMEEMKRTIEGLKQASMKPPKSEDEIEAWREAYPDFADILDTIVEKKVEGKLEKERPRYKELELTQEEIKRDKALMALKKLHPNCEEYFAPNNPFHKWLMEQPQKHQDFIYKSTNVDDAALVLDKYELYLERNSKSRDDDEGSSKKAAKSVRTRSEQAAPDSANGDYWYTESEIEKSARKPGWWDANEARILEAQRKGKIFLDISGGAR